MAALIHLDTHVLAWLYLADVDLLSATARELIERDELATSPMAVLELTYLHEVGRLRVDGATVLASLGDELGLTIDSTPFGDVVATAQGMTWTRDPFDRLIAAHAVAAGAILLTRDERLHARVPGATW